MALNEDDLIISVETVLQTFPSDIRDSFGCDDGDSHDWRNFDTGGVALRACPKCSTVERRPADDVGGAL